MTTSLLDAFELVAHSEQLHARLDAAAAELSKRSGLAEEKAWLSLASQRVAAARGDVGDLLTRVLRLPEIEPVKGDRARILQAAAVDALERLHSGIMFAGGNRSPLIEALYGKLKTPMLRRCDRADFERSCADFEKRLESTYARRMLADATYAVVAPVLLDLKRAIATWRGVFTSGSLTEAEAQGLREELEATARTLEVPCRQARLLAQAALVPMKELLDSSGLAQKARRRGPREADEDTHPLLERDPPDPGQPSPEELAELAAAQAAAEAEKDAEKEAAATTASAEAAEPVAAEAPEPEPAAGSAPAPADEPRADKPRRGSKAKPPAEA